MLRLIWNGPHHLPATLRLEWRFVLIRWVGIFSVAPGLLLVHLTPDRLEAAYTVLAIAIFYNSAVQYLMPVETNGRRIAVDDYGAKPGLWIGANHQAVVMHVEPLD